MLLGEEQQFGKLMQQQMLQQTARAFKLFLFLKRNAQCYSSLQETENTVHVPTRSTLPEKTRF